MELTDRVFIALLATLALTVLFVERRSAMRNVPPHVLPQPPRKLLTSKLNVPMHRHHSTVIDDVAYIDADDAAGGEFE